MIVITGAKFAARLLDIVGKHKDIFVSRGENVQIVSQLGELSRLEIAEGQCLICFNTGIIVPKSLLAKVGRESYNSHAAPPRVSRQGPPSLGHQPQRYPVRCDLPRHDREG
jgi:hypothetical protein